MRHKVSQERAETIARELAKAYVDTMFHVIRDIVSREHPEEYTHYIMNESWVSGEMIGGVRVASFIEESS